MELGYWLPACRPRLPGRVPPAWCHLHSGDPRSQQAGVGLHRPLWGLSGRKPTAHTHPNPTGSDPDQGKTPGTRKMAGQGPTLLFLPRGGARVWSSLSFWEEEGGRSRRCPDRE